MVVMVQVPEVPGVHGGAFESPIDKQSVINEIMRHAKFSFVPPKSAY